MKANYIELEKKEGQISDIPYTIIKVEYPNLKKLQDNDLLMANDKGQWLCGFIGLKENQKVDFKELDNGYIVPQYLYLNSKDKKEIDLFSNNLEITKVLQFDLNHSWNKTEKNTQLDEEECLKIIKNTIEYINNFNKNISKKDFEKLSKEENIHKTNKLIEELITQEGVSGLIEKDLKEMKKDKNYFFDKMSSFTKNQTTEKSIAKENINIFEK
ncbi:TPA: hypothetical protein SD809_002071 [Campylobacter coli]|uniref:hypothetical protein n=1 Tax=Campylobacter TaxID=194 RepID=UPI000699CAA9|nr:hypothetical protein [Campylobacter jejuni]EAH6015473.1 hypothetical protein [Campylobacter coli]EAJ2615955.1 hypothetical protein [Campylobacter coli]EAK6082184.1 hypothetical protein [Campylobacter coli]EAK8016432.1 hypothetical protein [Campylobacter jejuni]EAK8016718.1 hypothetical protein [Campylobacter jejuni]